MRKRARSVVVPLIDDDEWDEERDVKESDVEESDSATIATVRQRWRGQALPLAFAGLCAVILAITPTSVVAGGGFLVHADKMPASALLIWLADVCVVVGVALCRKAPWLAFSLVSAPFVVVLFTWAIPLGWWVALVMLAAVAAMDSWRRALVPGLVSIGVITVFATSAVVPLVTPIGPVYAVAPLAMATTPPSGVRAGTTSAVPGIVRLTVVDDAVPLGDVTVGIDPQTGKLTQGAPDAAESSTTIEVLSQVPGRAEALQWGRRWTVLAAYLTLTAVVIVGFATVAAARRAGEARRSAVKESLAAEAAYKHATVVETVLTERSRVARDLHDVVAHHISLIAVRAESARYVIDNLPEEGRQAFADIADEARSALGELRQILTVLQRTEGATPPDDTSASRSPQPGSSDVLELIRAATDAGQEVTLLGAVPDLPPAQGLVVYRIVQESLTNARRHAPGAPVTVGVEFARTGCRVRISNPVTSRPGRTGRMGRGIVGMRERVEALGGTLTVTTTDPLDAQFVVDARLPGVVTRHDPSEPDSGTLAP